MEPRHHRRGRMIGAFWCAAAGAARLQTMALAGPSESTASAWEWLQAGLLAVLLTWTTLGLGGYVPANLVVGSALVGVLLVVHLVERAFTRRPLPRANPAGWVVLPFLAYAAANVAWVSPVKWLGWRDWFWWAEIVVVFWVALNGVRSRGPRRLVFSAIVALALISVAMACYQRFIDAEWLMLGRRQAPQFLGRSSGPFGSPNSLAALLLLVFPPVAALAVRARARPTERVWWGWVSIVLAFGLVLPISRGAWIALGLALTLWPLFATRGGLRRRALFASGAFVLVVLASAIVIGVAPKVRARFAQMVANTGELSRPILWRAGWKLFKEAPLLGTGAASYNVLFEKHRPERFLDEPEWAHNDYLNTLSDYGATGALLLFGGALVIALRCAAGRRQRPAPTDWLDDRAMLRGMGVALLAFAFHLAVDFHLKIPALGMTFATIAGLAVSRAWPSRDAATERWAGYRVACLGVACGAALLIAVQFFPSFYAHALDYRARRAVDGLANMSVETPGFGEGLREAQRDLTRAVAVAPEHAQAWADLAYVSALMTGIDAARHDELAKASEHAAERALALSTAPSEFWIRRGVARDLQGRWLEAGPDFAEAVARAPRNPIAWYYQAEHFSRKRRERQLAEAAVAFCLRLDPTNTRALALRQRLAVYGEGP